MRRDSVGVVSEDVGYVAICRQHSHQYQLAFNDCVVEVVTIDGKAFQAHRQFGAVSTEVWEQRQFLGFFLQLV